MTHLFDNRTVRRRCILTGILLVGIGCLSVGCRQAVKWDEPATAAPQQQTGGTGKRSARGNPAFYEVYGQRYYVMDNSAGFKERGVASWYGKKFHGRQTSSGATYDMHAMTAAHKTLPLPTKVRVRNLKNGRSVIVLVNDRGPFIDNRIIDLSFAAATQLDMITDGTALVEINVLTDNRSPPDSKAAAMDRDLPEEETTAINLYLQVGAFGDRANAQDLLNRLHGRGFKNVKIRSDTSRVPPLFRVRLGPIADVTEYDTLVEKMASLQIVDTHLVTESGDAAGS